MASMQTLCDLATQKLDQQERLLTEARNVAGRDIARLGIGELRYAARWIVAQQQKQDLAVIIAGSIGGWLVMTVVIWSLVAWWLGIRCGAQPNGAYACWVTFGGGK